MFFRKSKPKPTKEELEQAKVFLLLQFGSMDAAYRHWIVTDVKTEPAQYAVLLDYRKKALRRTSGTGPR